MSVDSVTENSVTLYLTKLNEYWQVWSNMPSGTITAHWYVGYAENPPSIDYPFKYGETELAQGEDSTGYITFTGFERDTQYFVMCQVYHEYGYLLAEFEGSFITTSAPTISGDTWWWTQSNGSATVDETWLAYVAARDKRETYEFSHKVWNDIVDKTKYVISTCYGYDWWDTWYATYEDTKMNTDNIFDRTLTAVRFNSVRNNIDLASSYIGVGVTFLTNPVKKNDIVKGQYFIDLADALNAIIWRM